MTILTAGKQRRAYHLTSQPSGNRSSKAGSLSKHQTAPVIAMAAHRACLILHCNLSHQQSKQKKLQGS